jgi:site-specific recombinase XerD
MIDDMTAQRFSEATQKDYVRNVRNFAAFLGRSPDTATSDDLRRFQLNMAQRRISPGSINAAIAALRFFFAVTLEPRHRGLSPDGSRWIAGKPGFLLPVRVLSRLFRRLLLDGVAA